MSKFTEHVPVVEVCIDSVESAIQAHKGGAQRVELCADLLEGGLTPSYGMIKLVRDAFPAPGKLMILIRPRGGDFCYSQQEIQVMREDIEMAASLKADGVVFGMLTPDGHIDTDNTAALLHLATSKGLDVTFHRAFDMVKDQATALEQLAAVGIKRVLTSGGMPSALAGAGELAKLVGAAGKRVAIMAGGGVTEENAAELISRTGVCQLHSSAKRSLFSKMTFRKPGMSMMQSDIRPSDYAWGCADMGRVTALLAATTKAVSELPCI